MQSGSRYSLTVSILLESASSDRPPPGDSKITGCQHLERMDARTYPIEIFALRDDPQTPFQVPKVSNMGRFPLEPMVYIGNAGLHGNFFDC